MPGPPATVVVQCHRHLLRPSAAATQTVDGGTEGRWQDVTRDKVYRRAVEGPWEGGREGRGEGADGWDQGLKRVRKSLENLVLGRGSLQWLVWSA